MQVESILNRLQKHVGFRYTKASFEEEGQKVRILVQIEPRRRSLPSCRKCRRKGPVYDRARKARRFDFVPLWGLPVLFLYASRRVKCGTCGVTTEFLPWTIGKNRSTTTYRWFLANWAKRLSWEETARVFETTWNTVYRAVQMAVEYGRALIRVDQIKAIGVDELAWKKSSQDKFATLVYQLDDGKRRLLWAGPNRRESTLRKFFEWLGQTATERLGYVSSDLWKPYLKVIREKASQAIHVVDPFHIAQHLGKAVDQVRRAEVKRLRGQGKPAVLRNSRWCLLRRPENRTEKDEMKLAELMRYNLRSVRAALIRWDFDWFWGRETVAAAATYLERWCRRAMRSRLEPLKKVVRMLRRHRPYLLAYIKANGQIATGAVEGLNNKARVAMKRAYGFRTYRGLETALYHALGDLPQPPFLHRFW